MKKKSLWLLMRSLLFSASILAPGGVQGSAATSQPSGTRILENLNIVGGTVVERTQDKEYPGIYHITWKIMAVYCGKGIRAGNTFTEEAASALSCFQMRVTRCGVRRR